VDMSVACGNTVSVISNFIFSFLCCMYNEKRGSS
jgi:hypothetical protein